MTKRERNLVEKMMATPKKEWSKTSFSRGPYRGNGYMLDRGGYSLCISYITPVMLLTPKRELIRLWDGYTKTTIGHISDWCFCKNLPSVGGKVWDGMVPGRKYPEQYVRCMTESHSRKRIFA